MGGGGGGGGEGDINNQLRNSPFVQYNLLGLSLFCHLELYHTCSAVSVNRVEKRN